MKEKQRVSRPLRRNRPGPARAGPARCGPARASFRNFNTPGSRIC